jgi:hypothetical protein
MDNVYTQEEHYDKLKKILMIGLPIDGIIQIILGYEKFVYFYLRPISFKPSGYINYQRVQTINKINDFNIIK